MKADVINMSNAAKVSTIDLEESIFDVPLRSDILARVVKWQLAKMRAGNHKSKTRAEVNHSTRKPFKQKGTGRARQGMTSVSQMRGGGVVFGPVVRDHSHKLLKKVRVLGLKTAISTKFREGNVIFVENFDVNSHKTSDFSQVLSKINVSNGLFVTQDTDNLNLKRASSNLIKIDVIPQIGLNVYDILQHEKLIFSINSVKDLMERL